MAEYTFEQLSPADFERLSRDLIEALLGLPFESFSDGKDGGVDFRRRDEAGTTVIQCKHFRRSGLRALVRSLRGEVRKKGATTANRYILTTSVSLTPAGKEEVVRALQPLNVHSHDVFGQEDLNGLLSRFGDVERRHYKLWITSVAVIQSVLHSGVFTDSGATVESIRKRVARFVVTPALERAATVLRDQHVCVVAGIPGIGKTTLAEMLLLEQVERGYEAVRVWNDIGEATAVLVPHRKQVFYYDDFLGKTGLTTKLSKNEDQRLLHFIQRIREQRNTRFVLTTREYILNQARAQNEALQDPSWHLSRCMVTLDDYTDRIRAKILYNHLYFSDLPSSFVDALVEEQTYRRIVRHANYSPRLIEAMTKTGNLLGTSATEYPATFVNNLDNPKRLWETAYREHLSFAAQNLLLVLVSMPDSNDLAALNSAFGRFHTLRATKYMHAVSPYDARRSLRELDGTFVTTTPGYQDIRVAFANPSVRDFLESQISPLPVRSCSKRL